MFLLVIGVSVHAHEDFQKVLVAHSIDNVFVPESDLSWHRY